MYRSHSKDINRNKSFHTLTFANLRKVEVAKEKEAQRQQASDERKKELQRDQEEQRYDDLLASSFGGNPAMKQVKNIFAAEYDAEAQHQVASSAQGSSRLTKFVKEEQEEGSSSRLAGYKRERDNEGPSPSPAPTKTGFVSSSEASQTRKAVERSKKQSADPLQKLKCHENDLVAAAASRSHKKCDAPSGVSAIGPLMEELRRLRRS